MRLGPVLEEKIRTLMGSYEREESALIPALMAVQAEYGCVDSEAAAEVSAIVRRLRPSWWTTGFTGP